MTQSSPEKSAPTRRSWLLMASLALNLLVVGAIAGTLISGRHRHFGGFGGYGRDGGMGGELGLMGFVRSLPAERQRALREAADLQRGMMRPLRQAVRAARAEANTALSAEPFYAARLQAALSALADAEAKARSAATTVLVKAVNQMTPAERSAFTSWRKTHERNPRPDPTPADRP
jgi:uncharacterized membrane protein